MGPLPTGEDEAVGVDVVLRVLAAPVPELLLSFVVLLPLPRIGKLGRPSSG